MPGSAAVVVFWLLAGLTLAGAMVVAASRNIVHSAFALLATFLGVAGLYALLHADLMAVVQLLVYVGGVLVVILFAVMLTSRIGQAQTSNPSLGRAQGSLVALLVAGPLVWLATNHDWATQPTPPTPTTAAVGASLLGPYVLPFEVISVLLLAALVGAVTLARRPQAAAKASTTEEARFHPAAIEPPTAELLIATDRATRAGVLSVLRSSARHPAPALPAEAPRGEGEPLQGESA
jgi:NAD(P)H-quinone oxidoreductase subunit 6